MATQTKAELRNKVLKHLGVLAAGESPDATDAQDVEDVIDAVFEELRTDGVTPFELTAIPEWAQIPLRNVVAADCLETFGIGDSRNQTILGYRERSLARLHRQSAMSKLPNSRGMYF